jgi:hypothetical protein
LNDDVGIIEGTEEIVTEFLNEVSSTGAIEKMRAIAGGEFYVKIMERIAGKGIETVKKDAEVIEGMLGQRKGCG